MSTSTNKRELSTEEMKAVQKFEKIDMDQSYEKIKKEAKKILLSTVHADVREEYEDVLAQAKLLNK